MAARQHEPEAQFAIAHAYKTGQGFNNRNKALALYHWEQAEQVGHVRSQAEVGHAYMEGEGVPVNFERSLSSTVSAAISGSTNFFGG